MAELEGFEAQMSALRGLKHSVVGVTPAALSEAAHLLQSQVTDALGRTSHPPGTPTPSPPGQPPSMISGNLRRSIQVEGPSVTGPGRWSMQVGTGLVYSRVQELGGGPSNLPARPYMAPSLVEALPGMAAFFEAEWAAALNA